MKYLADTSVVVNHLRGKKKIDEEFFKDGVAISIITLGELIYGAYRSKDPKKTKEIVNNFLSDLSVETINLDDEIIDEYAKIKASLESLGQKLDDFDLLIAATAREYSLHLLTENKRHFQRISGI